jgi:hypothetical protein
MSAPPIDFACPFCNKTQVSLFMGTVVFSAKMGDKELCDPVKVTLAAPICAKSHLFFVPESDMAGTMAAAAA